MKLFIEKNQSGYLYIWINGALFYSGINIGTCSNNDVIFEFESQTWRPMTGYIDDVTVYYSPINIKTISTEVPDRYYLYQNYPNPFNSTTNIKFDIPKFEHVILKVYDAVGQEIELLFNEKLSAGTYSIDWKVDYYPNGVYFYRIVSGNFMDTKKNDIN